MASSTSQTDWSSVSGDPDLYHDLGYELIDLDVLDIDAADQVIVLPEETEMLKMDAFVVIADEDLCDLSEWS